ncbi:ABC transporter C family member 8-like protein [Tanacetum coccineum]
MFEGMFGNEDNGIANVVLWAVHTDPSVWDSSSLCTLVFQGVIAIRLISTSIPDTVYRCHFLVLLPKGYIPPGLVGLSLSYALALTNAHVFLTRWYCGLANYVISVERIKQYMHIPPEPPAAVEKNRPHLFGL